MNKVIVIIILAIIAQPQVRITEEHCGIAELMGSI